LHANEIGSEVEIKFVIFIFVGRLPGNSVQKQQANEIIVFKLCTTGDSNADLG
jgi:hypothetical protein